MGGEGELLELEELGVDAGLVLEDVEAGARDPALLERLDEGRLVHDGTPGDVDEERGPFHQ